MSPEQLIWEFKPSLQNASLIVGFSGWMDGGEVSTGTIDYLIEQLDARLCAYIDSDDFFIYNFPGSMDISSLFRPNTVIKKGIVEEYDPPQNLFLCSEKHNIVLFTGKEPNLLWDAYGDCIFSLCKDLSVKQVYFIGSVAGVTPHTREPRISFSASDESLRDRLVHIGLKPSDYEGPASFVTYLTARAPDEETSMASLVEEVPAYIQGYNPGCIETALRLLGRLLDLRINLDELHKESEDYNRKVTELVESQQDLAEKVKELERDYDNEAFDREMSDLKDWLGDQGLKVE